MSLYSNLYGGGSGAPIGAIVKGVVSPGGDWLKLDGAIYNKADYPSLDTSCMMTTASNTLVTRQTLTVAGNSFAKTNSTAIIYNASSVSTTYFSSTDGVTWTSRTFVANFASGWTITSANNVFIAIQAAAASATIYTSTDGVAWTSRTLPSTLIHGAVAYINGYYILFTSNNSANAIYTVYRSTDLATWTVVTIPTYTPGGSEGHVFSPLNKSVYVDPVKGLTFGIYYGASQYAQIINTKNGIDYQGLNTYRLVQGNVSSSDTYLTGYNYSVSPHDDGSFLMAAGLFSYSSNGFQPIYGDMNYPQSKNLFTTLVVGVANVGLSEDFGRTCKLSYGAGSYLVGAVFNNKIITCNTSSVVKTVDIDTTKFTAIYPAITSDVEIGNLYIKAR